MTEVIRGYGYRSKEIVDIVVTRKDEQSAYGRIVKNGRVTARTDTLRIGFRYDVLTGEDMITGWEPSTVTILKPESLSGKLKDMEVGDIIDMPKSERNIDTCRSVAARIAVNEGRGYTVNRTPDGCKITRTA